KKLPIKSNEPPNFWILNYWIILLSSQTGIITVLPITGFYNVVQYFKSGQLLKLPFLFSYPHTFLQFVNNLFETIPCHILKFCHCCFSKITNPTLKWYDGPMRDAPEKE